MGMGSGSPATKVASPITTRDNMGKGLWVLGATGSDGRAGSGSRRGHKEADAGVSKPSCHPILPQCPKCRAMAGSLAPLGCRMLARGLQHDHEWDHSSKGLLAPCCAAKETKAQAKRGRLSRMNSARKALEATAVGLGNEEVVL